MRGEDVTEEARAGFVRGGSKRSELGVKGLKAKEEDEWGKGEDEDGGFAASEPRRVSGRAKGHPKVSYGDGDGDEMFWSDEEEEAVFEGSDVEVIEVVKPPKSAAKKTKTKTPKPAKKRPRKDDSDDDDSEGGWGEGDTTTTPAPR